MLVARLGGDASASPEPDGLKAPPPPRFSVSLSQPAKNATLFLSFPHVCPEPVLVKRSFYIQMAAQKVAFCAPEIDPDVGLCPRATLRGSLNLNRVRHVADVHEVILWGDLILVLTAAAAAAAFRRDHRRLLVHIHHRHTCMKDTYRHVYAWTRTRTTTRAQPHGSSVTIR